MDRIETQSVDVKVPHPHQRIVQEESPYLVRPCIFKVDGAAPWSVVGINQIWSELARVIARGAEVVVDDIEQDCQSHSMGRIDKSLEPIRASIRLMHSK